MIVKIAAFRGCSVRLKNVPEFWRAYSPVCEVQCSGLNAIAVVGGVFHPHTFQKPEEAMSHVHTILPTTFLDTYDTVARRLEAMVNGKSGDNPHEYLIRIESFLDSLPLATDEYGLAQNRIRNARRYYQAHEVGAARYELRLLMCSLRHRFADQVSVEPRRRLRQPIGR